jgi:hypothetical protein
MNDGCASPLLSSNITWKYRIGVACMKEVVAADANRNREMKRFKYEEKKSIDQVFM